MSAKKKSRPAARTSQSLKLSELKSTVQAAVKKVGGGSTGQSLVIGMPEKPLLGREDSEKLANEITNAVSKKLKGVRLKPAVLPGADAIVIGFVIAPPESK
jgi:hypothetical protein